MRAHLDIEVSDLERGVAHAVALGATVADVQPQDDVRSASIRTAIHSVCSCAPEGLAVRAPVAGAEMSCSLL
jgi:hypothetical protein